MKIILYEVSPGQYASVSPNPEMDIDDVAAISVPLGTPFEIIDIPANATVVPATTITGTKTSMGRSSVVISNRTLRSRP